MVIMGRSFKTKVVGVTFNNPDGSSRQKIISECKAGEELVLRRDYNNFHDEYAIAVLRKTGEQVGFIARDVAFRHEGMNDLTPHLDQGGELKAHIVDITGDPLPGFWARLFRLPTKNLGCVIQIEVGDVPYQVMEEEARELRDKGKNLEKINPAEAVKLYKQSIAKLIQVDNLIRKTYAFRKQTEELGYDPGTWRRTPFPIAQIIALLEKNGSYSECLNEIENYKKMDDKKGLSKTDTNTISKRESRILSAIASK